MVVKLYYYKKFSGKPRLNINDVHDELTHDKRILTKLSVSENTIFRMHKKQLFFYIS